MPAAVKKRSARRRPVFTFSEARANLGRVLDAAERSGTHVVIRRRGEAPVIVMNVREYIRLTCPEPESLRLAGLAARRAGLDKMTMDEINAEIDAARRERRRGHGSAAPRA